MSRVFVSNGYFVDFDLSGTAPTMRIGLQNGSDELTSEAFLTHAIEITQRDIADLLLGMAQMLEEALQQLKGLDNGRPATTRNRHLRRVPKEGSPQPER